MSMYALIIMVIGLGILGYALVYTLLVGKERKAVKGDLDTEIPDQVQKHAYIRNPIFLTYAICFAFVLILVMYFALTANW